MGMQRARAMTRTVGNGLISGTFDDCKGNDDRLRETNQCRLAASLVLACPWLLVIP